MEKEMKLDERLKIDYEQTGKYFYELAATRFKLLAFVPTITGLALANIDIAVDPALAIAAGIFGFLVTCGIMMYDLRNTQIYDAMQLRLKTIEAYLGLPLSKKDKDHYYVREEKGEEVEYLYKRTGTFLDRPRRKGKLFLIEIFHDKGLWIIYSATLAVWLYLVCSGFVQYYKEKYFQLSNLYQIAIFLLPVVISSIAYWQMKRTDTVTDSGDAFRPEVHKLLQTPFDDGSI